MEILRHIKDRLFPDSAETERIAAQHRSEELNYVREAIQEMYIHGQVSLSMLSNDLRAFRRPTSGLAREIAARVSFDSERITELFSDEIMEAGIEKTLERVSATPEQGHEIRRQALQGAKDYWEDRLTQPDLIADEIMLGRRRLVQITAKMAKLDENPSQNPQV